jgi:hypothetical protein
LLRGAAGEHGGGYDGEPAGDLPGHGCRRTTRPPRRRCRRRRTSPGAVGRSTSDGPTPPHRRRWPDCRLSRRSLRSPTTATRSLSTADGQRSRRPA